MDAQDFWKCGFAVSLLAIAACGSPSADELFAPCRVGCGVQVAQGGSVQGGDSGSSPDSANVPPQAAGAWNVAGSSAATFASGDAASATGGNADSASGGGAGASDAGESGSDLGAAELKAPPTECAPSSVGASALSLYEGGGGSCSLSLDPPRSGGWFAFDDGTLAAPLTPSLSAEAGGHNGASCRIHASGHGATGWGAGIAFGFAEAGEAAPCIYDATPYRAIRLYLKGTTNATEGQSYAAAANLVRVNVVTTATSDTYGTCSSTLGKCNDHFGVWCAVGTDWVECDVPFDNLSQRGWGIRTSFDRAQLLNVQVVALRDPNASSPTSWDFAASDVAFY